LSASRRGHDAAHGAALAVLLLLAMSARSGDYKVGNLAITDPWSRPTPPIASVGAVYFSITNASRKADRLLAISSPIARQAEIHESRVVNGTVEMRPVESIECPPGATVRIEPGGLHVMLLGLTHPLAAGTTFPLSLRFRDAGSVTVQVAVASRQEE
jgi:periplasmic copper chaperone A